MDGSKATVKGKVVEVDICEREVGYVLSVGIVSIWLAPAVAIDVLDTLARAIAAREAGADEHGVIWPAARGVG